MPGGIRAIWELSEGQRLRFAAGVGALVASAACLYLVPLVPQAIFDGVIGDPAKAPALTRSIVGAAGGREFLAANLWIAGLAMVAIATVAGVFLHLKTRFATGAAEEVARRLRDRLYDHLQRLPCRSLEGRESGDVIQRCTSDVDAVRNFLAGQVTEICRAVLMLVVPIPLMAMLDVRMTLVSIVLVPVIIAFSLLFFRRMRPVFLRKEEAEGRMTATVTENLTGIRTAKAFARQEFENRRFASASGRFRDEDMRLFTLFATFWSISDLLCFLQQIAVVAYGAWRLAGGEIEVGVLFYFLTVVTMFIWPVRMLGRLLAELGKAMVATGRIRELLDLPDEFGDEPRAVRDAGSGGLEIEFDRVTFAHGAVKVLDEVSFRVPPGGTLGLVGPSGSGKSTVIALLLRLYEPDSGAIRIGGRDLRTIPRAGIRQAIASVLQQPFLYSRPLRENILIAAGHAGGDAAMIDATRDASVHEAIESFPQGYSTVVGERGMTLSGGQRQRVAIARALVREPRILLLDDALSAVDTETEASILEAFRRRGGSHTTVVVAHRLSTLLHADAIVVLERGKVVQSGTHADLKARPGLYRTLWEIQSTMDNAGPEAAHG
jgi:ATP-binding cassette subfamily B protein